MADAETRIGWPMDASRGWDATTLVAGASSGPGRLVVAELLARGLPPRVLVRSDEQATEFRGLEHRTG